MQIAKTIDQLQAEIGKKETQLSQERHKEQRPKTRLTYYEKGERGKRTHRLCNLGGTVESLTPEVKELTWTEISELMEYIFSLPEVQRAVRHVAITHAGKIKREEEKAGRADRAHERDPAALRIRRHLQE